MFISTMCNSSFKTFTERNLNDRLVYKVFVVHTPSFWFGIEQNLGFTPDTIEEIRISVFVQMLFTSPLTVREKNIGVVLILQ